MMYAVEFWVNYELERLRAVAIRVLIRCSCEMWLERLRNITETTVRMSELGFRSSNVQYFVLYKEFR